jgi:D-alanyl-D-alanine carboxypeptidase
MKMHSTILFESIKSSDPSYHKVQYSCVGKGPQENAKKKQLTAVLLRLLVFFSLFVAPASEAAFVHAAEIPKAGMQADEAELRNFASLSYYLEEYSDRYILYKEKNPEFAWEDVITHVNIGLDKPFYSSAVVISEPGRIEVLVNKYNKLPDDFVPDGFKRSDRSVCRLSPAAAAAFEEMQKAAAADKIKITPISAYRSNSYQDAVYWKQPHLAEFFKRSISRSDLTKSQQTAYRGWRDQVSARRGFSEHQTGLAVDINTLDHGFGNTRTGKWLAKNSYRFGFILRYPEGKEKITGYIYEPWHFRYLGKDLAGRVYASGLTYDEYYVRYIMPEAGR